MQLLNFLFQNSQKLEIQRLQQAQVKVSQLQHQLNLLTKYDCESTGALHRIKARLHLELNLWENKLKQYEVSLPRPMSEIDLGFSVQSRQSGLPP